MTASLGLATRFILWTADSTPDPVDGYTGDPNLISPGVLGFIMTFIVALATVFLIIDMTRRMRRVRYRAEVREKLAAEQLDAELAALANGEIPAAETVAPSTGTAQPRATSKKVAPKKPGATKPAPKSRPDTTSGS